ncbi:MAG TPA: FAD/NAD(P)-binding protein [Nocardioidaceae bacterium]
MTSTVPRGGRPIQAPDPMMPRRFEVTARDQATADTWTLLLEPLEGPPLVFGPGQFTMLHAFGVGEVPVSISGDPTAEGPLEHTIRDVGSVTHALVGSSVGSTVGVRGPYGAGWDVASARGGDVVVVAGGIGLAPLRPAILEIAARRSEYARVVVLYGARTPADLLFTESLERWAAAHDVTVEVTVDSAGAGWTGRVGLVTPLITAARFDGPRTTALVCGPEVMMRFAAATLIDRGVPPERIRLSMERNMKCGIGLCGHCQLREVFVCLDGPVLPYDRLRPLMATAEL